MTAPPVRPEVSKGPSSQLPTTHEPRLARALRELLQASRVGALGTVDDHGRACVSMVPLAWLAASAERARPSLVLHVSGLAAHTAHLEARPDKVSLMVMQPEVPGEPVHALPRASLEGDASFPARDSAAWQACRAAYLARFPEAEPMTGLGDFRFVVIEVTNARHVAGFGAARNVDADELAAFA
jgi:putative heme iron utilization protein